MINYPFSLAEFSGIQRVRLLSDFGSYSRSQASCRCRSIALGVAAEIVRRIVDRIRVEVRNVV